VHAENTRFFEYYVHTFEYYVHIFEYYVHILVSKLRDNDIGHSVGVISIDPLFNWEACSIDNGAASNLSLTKDAWSILVILFK